jgi:hypothetical protein
MPAGDDAADYPIRTFEGNAAEPTVAVSLAYLKAAAREGQEMAGRDFESLLTAEGTCLSS